MEIGVEKSLAGILIQKPEVIHEISGLVFADDFLDLRARKVFETVETSVKVGDAVDLPIVASQMVKHAVWLAEAYDVMPINYKTYAKQISDLARQRRLKEGAKRIAASQSNDPDELLYHISKLHQDESKTTVKDGDISNAVERTKTIINKNKDRGKPHGVGSGWSFLDEIYVRFVPAHMWVVTGFTSTGKSLFVTEQIARLKRHRVALISTEMTEEQFISRMVARETGYHNQLILSGRLAPEEEMRTDRVMEDIAQRDLKIYDNIYDIAELESVVMQQSMGGGLDVVFIDYVQQLRGKGIPQKELGAELANRIQQLAKMAKTCIVCMSQVSNQVGRGEVEQFEAKGAGEWAACADVGVRLKRKKSDQYALMFDMQKGRHFGTTERELAFMANFTRISE